MTRTLASPAIEFTRINALAAGQLLAGLVVGTSPHDPLALGGAAAVTVCAGGLGCLLTARGAARTNPAVALRD